MYARQLRPCDAHPCTGRNILLQSIIYGSLRYWFFTLVVPPEFIKIVESAIALGDKTAAAAALAAAQPELARGVSKGVFHKNTASRKFGRLTKAVGGLA